MGGPRRGPNRKLLLVNVSGFGGVPWKILKSQTYISKFYRFWGGPVENFKIPNLLLSFPTNFLVKKVTDICLFWAFLEKNLKFQ